MFILQKVALNKFWNSDLKLSITRNPSLQTFFLLLFPTEEK